MIHSGGWTVMELISKGQVLSKQVMDKKILMTAGMMGRLMEQKLASQVERTLQTPAGQNLIEAIKAEAKNQSTKEPTTGTGEQI
jgi:hypothetical protein